MCAKRAEQAKRTRPDEAPTVATVAAEAVEVTAQPTPELPQPACATVGRIVHVWCPDLFLGPRPAIVVTDYESTLKVDVNVFLNGSTDEHALSDFRTRRRGNTEGLVNVYPPMTEQERDRLVAAERQGGSTRVMWAEFPSRV
jgi:hypothetical protein